jgi:YfiH family protein
MAAINKHIAHYPGVDIEFVHTKDLPVIIGCTHTSEEKPFSIGPSYNMDADKKYENQKKLAQILKTDLEKMIYINQVHGDGVYVVDKDNPFPTDGKMGGVGEFDAAISRLPGSQLNLSIADCGGVMMYHPEDRAIAAVHSGWKGTKAAITEKTLMRMAAERDKKEYVKDLKVWFMPSASGEAYEVGEEFKEYFPETTVMKEGKCYFDNRKEIKRRLYSYGITEENLYDYGECTISKNCYHSFRRDGEDSGRMNAFIKLEG